MCSEASAERTLTEEKRRSDDGPRDRTIVPPNGICSDLSYSSLEVKGCGISEILYLAAVFTRLSDIITLGIFVSLRPFFFSFVSSITLFISLSRMLKILVLTPEAPGPAQSPHPAFTSEIKRVGGDEIIKEAQL